VKRTIDQDLVSQLRIRGAELISTVCGVLLNQAAGRRQSRSVLTREKTRDRLTEL
jgi:hypothetical protein